jgi:hypothetical protein
MSIMGRLGIVSDDPTLDALLDRQDAELELLEPPADPHALALVLLWTLTLELAAAIGVALLIRGRT